MSEAIVRVLTRKCPFERKTKKIKQRKNQNYFKEKKIATKLASQAQYIQSNDPMSVLTEEKNLAIVIPKKYQYIEIGRISFYFFWLFCPSKKERKNREKHLLFNPYFKKQENVLQTAHIFIMILIRV